MAFGEEDACESGDQAVAAWVVDEVAPKVLDAGLAGCARVAFLLALLAVRARSYVSHHGRFGTPLGAQGPGAAFVTPVPAVLPRGLEALLLIRLVGYPA